MQSYSGQHSEEGTVYILTNPSMPGLVKIGMTKGSPYKRAQELSGGTGIPTPYEVAAYARVSNRHRAEREMHTRFAARRTNARREFFAVPVAEAKTALDEIARRYPLRVIVAPTPQPSTLSSSGTTDIKINGSSTLIGIALLIIVCAVVGNAVDHSRGGSGNNSLRPTPASHTDAQRPATRTPRVLARATTSSTPRAEEDYLISLPPLKMEGKPVFGPESNTLNIESDRAMENPYWWSDVQASEFIVEVRFFNPQSLAEPAKGWDYGINFAHTGEAMYSVYVDSEQTWTLARRTLTADGIESEPLRRGSSTAINNTPDGSNLLQLAVQGDEALFFVNQEWVATLDLSGAETEGEIQIGSNYMTSNTVNGRATRFEKFTIWGKAP